MNQARPWGQLKLPRTNPLVVQTKCIEFLSVVGLPYPAETFSLMNKSKHGSIHIFYEACEAAELTPFWGPSMVTAICEFMDLRYLAPTTLAAHWKTLGELAEKLGQSITP